MIEIRGLKKSFKDQVVLDGLDLEIGSGEVVAIIGKSGGGKSVLLKHLIGLLKPDAGTILINGVDITSVDVHELRKVRQQFGVVFQGSALFDSLTVFGNVAFPLRERKKLPKEAIRENVLEALEDVGLRGMGNKYPAEISGGMKKRVALARALIAEPSIVLFDEPTTGLDPLILNSIHRLITHTHRKYRFTGIIISHEIPEIFDVADKVAMLYNGAIIQYGTPEEIKNTENPFVRQFITGSSEGPIETL
ncbi:MAG: ABC transporter ATP-binding protein [Nitrospiraceae bacterium]|nr:ABC transporter ATP-binding protein [Nitrospiraceae bacterium]